MRKLKSGKRLLLAVPFLLISSGVFAGLGGSATPTFPTPVAVGDSNLPVTLVIGPSAGSDAFPAAVDAGSIKFTMSCGTQSSPWLCTADADPGVFTIVDTTAVAGGSAGAGEVCNGITFDFGAEAANGQVAVTPSAPISFAAASNFCTINFAVSVNKIPTKDASAGSGKQTAQGGLFTMTGNNLEEATGTGADLTTVFACGVKVDKQVSCDGGTTWVDEDLVINNEDGTDTCNGLSTDAIKVRYQAQNTGTGCNLTGCTWEESNNAFGQPAEPFDIADGATTNLTTPASAICSTAFGDPQNPNEPNAIDISCNAQFGNPVTASDEASFACLTVEAKVDRNVACDGDPANDQTLVVSNEDGTNGCTTLDGNSVEWNYQSCNNGTAPLYDCVLVDVNTDVSSYVSVGDLAPNGCSDPSTVTQSNTTNPPLECSEALQVKEATDGRVDLTCCTRNVSFITECAEANLVSVYDKSNVTCNTQSGLEIVKTCVDSDADGTDDSVTVAVSAGAGDVGFTACTPTDTIYLDDPTCPPSGSGTPVALVDPTGPYSLAPGASETSEGTLPVLLEDACNTASVTCTDAYDDLVTEDAAPVICDFVGDGCITRTPGFWGNRPDTANDYLPITVCGETVNSVAANALSTTEAMCSVGKDGKILGSQVTQLIRQCTAAALNHAVSADEEGGCPHVDEENFADCCGAASGVGNLCSAQDEGGKSVSECIVLLDTFNNSLDTLQTDVFSGLGAAQPEQCKASKNNGYHPYAN